MLLTLSLAILIEMMAEASRKRNVIVDKIEWPVAKVNRLIELYEAQPLLYNNRPKEYHNINLKNDTLKTIAAALDVTSKYISLLHVVMYAWEVGLRRCLLSIIHIYRSLRRSRRKLRFYFDFVTMRRSLRRIEMKS